MAFGKRGHPAKFNTGPNALTLRGTGATINIQDPNVNHGSPNIFGPTTDTCGVISKLGGGSGGLYLAGITETAGTSAVLQLEAVHGHNLDTTKSTAGRAAIEARAYQHDGADSVANVVADANIFCVAAYRGGSLATVMIVDEDGEIHSDGGAQAAYDAYDDVALCRQLDLSTGIDVVAHEFDEFLSHRRQDLIDLGILSQDGFVNTTKLQRLHNGAIWQMATRLERIERFLERFEWIFHPITTFKTWLNDKE